MPPPAPSVVSLFSGAGGLDIGLERAGWQIVTATDNAPHAMRTLRSSQAAGIKVNGRDAIHMDGTRLLEADVRDLSARDVWPADANRLPRRPDLVVGGPPCQPWSSAGKQQGLNDPRGQLIAHFLRLIDEVRPRFVIFENVRGLVTARGETGTPGEVLASIQNDLASMGYASHVTTLNAADYGAAQRRVRLILVATDEYEIPAFPAPTHSRHSQIGLEPWQTLGDLLTSRPAPADADIVRPSGIRASALRLLTPGTGIKTEGRVMANRPSGQWGYRQDAFLADLALPSRTIRAASTPDWVCMPDDSDIRRLTWQECAALQGFPEYWAFEGTTSQRFQQIGNAVQVNMAEAVGGTTLEALAAGKAAHKPASPQWSNALQQRVRYTAAEHKVNGHLRVRRRAKDGPSPVAS